MEFESFDIEDDNFTFDQERAKRLMNLIIETFGEGKIELSAMNGISFASLDGELLKLMKKAGFHTINLSYVSTDPSTKERMRRPKPTTEFDRILEEAEQIVPSRDCLCHSGNARPNHRRDGGYVDLSDGEKSPHRTEYLLPYARDFSF